MKKGQFSFDLIFAIVIFMLMAASLAYFSNDSRLSQQKLLAKTQTARIAVDTGSIAAYSAMMDTLSDSYSYSYFIPHVLVAGAGATGCEIRTGNNGIEVIFDARHAPYMGEEAVRSGFASPLIQESGSLSCGDELLRKKAG
jgi:hypothetical protein